jgi:hypothetical protein
MPRSSAVAGVTVTVTSRVPAILGSFDAEHPSQSLTEIAHRANVTPPTAHRLSGNWRPGVRCSAPASVVT